MGSQCFIFFLFKESIDYSFHTLSKICCDLITLKFDRVKEYLIQNSQAVKNECGPQKGYGEKRCEIQGGGQEMAVMVG